MSRTEIWRSTTRIAATPVSQLDQFLPDHWQAAQLTADVNQKTAANATLAAGQTPAAGPRKDEAPSYRASHIE
jgi:hypothetical protein